MKEKLLSSLIVLLTATVSGAKEVVYNLTIAEQEVNITGKPVIIE